MTTSGCRSVKILSTTVGYSLVAMVTDLRHLLTYDSRGAWHTVYAMLHSNYKWCSTEINTVEKYYFR